MWIKRERRGKVDCYILHGQSIGVIVVAQQR